MSSKSDRNQESPDTNKFAKKGASDAGQQPDKQAFFLNSLWERIQTAFYGINKHENEIKELRVEIQDLRGTIEKLEKQLEKRYEEVDQRMALLITALSKDGRDTVATYVPQQRHTLLQPYQLCNEYRTLTEECFEYLTDELLKMLPNLDELNITAKVAFIKYTLAEKIFLADIPDTHGNEENDITAIADSIYVALQIAKVAGPDTLYHSLVELVKQGRQLAINIRRTDPAGRLVTYTNVAFDAAFHKAMSGYEGDGTVISTILPAYIIEDRVQEKALVFTDKTYLS